MGNSECLSFWLPRERYEFTARGCTFRDRDGWLLEFLWGDLYAPLLMWFPSLPRRLDFVLNGLAKTVVLNLLTLGRYDGSWGVQASFTFRHLDLQRLELLRHRLPFVRIPSGSTSRFVTAALEVFSGKGIEILEDPDFWTRARQVCRHRRSHFSRVHALMVEMPALAGVSLPGQASKDSSAADLAEFVGRSFRVIVTDRGVHVELAEGTTVDLSWDYLSSSVWIRGAVPPEEIEIPHRLQKLPLPPGRFLESPVWFKVFLYFRSVDMPGWCAVDLGRMGIRQSRKLKKFASWLAVYSAERAQ